MRRLGTSWRVSDLALIVYQVAAIMRSLYPRVRVREGHEISQGDE